MCKDSCKVNNGGCDPNATCSHDSTTYACKCTCNVGFVDTGLSGTVVCTLAPGHVIAYLKSAHINSTNPGFQADSCPTDTTNGYRYGWHLIAPDTASYFVAIKCTFKQAGVITRMIPDPSPKHAYVFTSTGDTLLGCWAVMNGPLTSFPLSHVCGPS